MRRQKKGRGTSSSLFEWQPTSKQKSGGAAVKGGHNPLMFVDDVARFTCSLCKGVCQQATECACADQREKEEIQRRQQQTPDTHSDDDTNTDSDRDSQFSDHIDIDIDIDGDNRDTNRDRDINMTVKERHMEREGEEQQKQTLHDLCEVPAVYSYTRATQDNSEKKSEFTYDDINSSHSDSNVDCPSDCEITKEQTTGKRTRRDKTRYRYVGCVSLGNLHRNDSTSTEISNTTKEPLYCRSCLEKFIARFSTCLMHQDTATNKDKDKDKQQKYECRARPNGYVRYIRYK